MRADKAAKPTLRAIALVPLKANQARRNTQTLFIFSPHLDGGVGILLLHLYDFLVELFSHAAGACSSASGLWGRGIHRRYAIAAIAGFEFSHTEMRGNLKSFRHDKGLEALFIL